MSEEKRVPVTRWGEQIVYFVYDEGTHCPNCGEKTVWVEDSAGDYYMGPTYCCVLCGHAGNCWGDSYAGGALATALQKAVREDETT